MIHSAAYRQKQGGPLVLPMELPMSASQISFAAFALAQRAALESTPPALAVPPAAPVVAHGVVGGECPRIDLRRTYRERTFVCDLRADYPAFDCCMDAPSMLPVGSSVVLGLEQGAPFVSGHGGRR